MKKIHLIAFNVPYPADYGGVIDIYYKVKSLKKSGVDVILHCYEYGRPKSPELEKICDSVFYYQRSKGALYAMDTIPYIVSTRNSKELAAVLSADDLPVIFEGLHTTACLEELSKGGRKTIVRTHNIEHEYYRGLTESETNLSRKMYFYSESVKLKRYEKVLAHAYGIAAISGSDREYFSQKFSNVKLIPAFHPFDNVEILEGSGSYALFHGNLSVPENKRAVLFLTENVFKDLKIEFVIAGKEPGSEIVEVSKRLPNIRLVANPDENEMLELIKNAHVNILATFQATGIKLKLLASLFCGRHCLVNPEMVMNTGLENLCHIAADSDEFRKKLLFLFEKEFDLEETNIRRDLLESEMSNVKNAEKLASMIF